MAIRSHLAWFGVPWMVMVDGPAPGGGRGA